MNLTDVKSKRMIQLFTKVAFLGSAASKFVFFIAFCIVFASLSSAPGAEAASETLAQERLQESVSRVHGTLSRVLKQHPDFLQLSNLEQAELLASSGLRFQMFRLQALGRMYKTLKRKEIMASGEFKDLERIGAEVQKMGLVANSIENHMGQFEFQKASGRMNLMQEAADRIHEIMIEQKLVDSNGIGPRFAEWYATIHALIWTSDVVDHKFVITVILGQISRVEKEQYDMTLLEDGLHELRRELRWIMLYFQASNGLFEKSATGAFQCSQERLVFSAFVDPKYNKLESNLNVKNKCPLSECLYDELAGAVGQFGAYKDKAEVTMAERGEVSTERTPLDLVGPAKESYQALHTSKMLERLYKQVRDCL